ncbi:hypothetical protein [Nocardia neocaledoniensis]|uniref:hypothetical protein n=1 Tax=Nocardia neocaledoniensis TaxID=236511 RepID=UPI002455EFD4|nr:hypothetical protein [Nocardia neocaledoniensis]
MIVESTRRSGSAPADDVRAWRRRWLEMSGFPAALAEAVVTEPGVDLHALLQLVDRGCAPELAVRILAPMPAEDALR